MYIPKPGCYTIGDVDANIINNTRNLYHENRTLTNGSYLFLANSAKEEVLGHNKQQMRHAILNHEAIFQHQLHELHRVYRRQINLMNEIQYGKFYENPIPVERSRPNLFLPRITSDETRSMSCITNSLLSQMKGEIKISDSVPAHHDKLRSDSRCKKHQRRLFDLEVPADNYIDIEEDEPWNNGLADLNEPVQPGESSSSVFTENFSNTINHSNGQLQRRDSFANSSSRIQLLCKDFPPNPQNGLDQLRSKELSYYNSDYEKTSANNSSVHGGSYLGHSYSLSESLQMQQRNVQEHFKLPAFNPSKTQPQRRNALFGVDISEKDNPNRGFLPSGSDSLDLQSVRSSSTSIFSSEKLANSSHNLVSRKYDNGSLDGQNQLEKLHEGLPWLRQPILEVSSEKTSHISEKTRTKINGHGSGGKILDEPIFDTPSVTKPIFDTPSVTKPSWLYSVNDDSTKMVGSLNNDLACDPVSVKFGKQIKESDIATTKGLNSHIDLNMSLNELDLEEDPVDLERPFESSPQEEFKISQEGTERNAAEAIVAISSYRQQTQDLTDSSLLWFADMIASFKGDLETEKTEKTEVFTDHTDNGIHLQKGIPQFDYFEFMTLKLTETKIDDQYDYKHKRPAILETKQDAEEPALPKRPRRGQGRRGRQLKDFQRDVLPGIASLSRHEVTEDLQTIESMIKITGGTWESSLTKRNAAKSNARGRRRTGGSAVISTVTTLMPPPTQQASPDKSGLDEKSLTGWGKRTRRPPRQRYPIGNSPLLVK